MPFDNIRHCSKRQELAKKLLEAIDQALGLDLSLFIEFTGLISWCPSPRIDWCCDNKRQYLGQRHVSSGTYLNTEKKRSEGSDFEFKDPEPCVLISASNTCCVGERSAHWTELSKVLRSTMQRKMKSDDDRLGSMDNDRFAPLVSRSNERKGIFSSLQQRRSSCSCSGG